MTVAYNRPLSRYAWRGASIVIVDNHGCAGDQPLSGFYFRETRYLGDLAFELGGDKAAVCSAADASPHRLEFTFVYPEGEEGAGSKNGLPFRTIDTRLVYEVFPSALDVTLTLTNRFAARVELPVSWTLSADYAGLTESADSKRRVAAQVGVTADVNEVVFTFEHDALPLRTVVRAEGGLRWLWADGKLSTTVVILRQETVEIRLTVIAIDSEDPISRTESERRVERLERWFASNATVHGSVRHPLIELTNHSLHDVGSLALLDGEEEEWLTPAAGAPMFLNLWARDALTAGWQMAALDGGEMIRSTLVPLARLQGTRIDDERDEQPGRIINRVQRTPASRLGLDPFARFYPDDASPFMFIIALGQLFAWSGDRDVLSHYWPNVQGILRWAAEYGDRDGDGYIEYLTRSPHGPKHQGWKDSPNAVVYEDGSQVEPPIAVCEIQGYYFAALQLAAVFAFVLGHLPEARRLRLRAKKLKEQFNRDFWMDSEGYFAFGLDSQKRVIRSITSNAAQCLTTGIVSDKHAPRLVARMFEPDLFSGWGIRTLSTSNPSYNPLSYHLGTVWPVENGTIMLGLRRYGFDAEAERLAAALCELALIWDGWRIPECIGGYSRDELSHPGAFVNANSPQAWNQSVFPMVMQSLLGMRALATLNLLIVDPVLPEWVPELTVENIRVGTGSISLRFRRDNRGRSRVKILERSGTVRLLRQPPLDSLSVGVWDRLGALARTRRR